MADPFDALELLHLRDAVVAPASSVQPGPDGRGIVDGGVTDRDGVPVALAQHVGGKQRNITPTRNGPPPAGRLEGTWLFGGWLYHHFGHFITESIGRLWAAPRAGENLAGIVFVPFGSGVRPDHARMLRDNPLVGETLRLLGIDASVEVPVEPMQVERLLVPRQLRVDKRAEPAIRHLFGQFFRQMLAPSVAGRKPVIPKAYVSRAGLPLTYGRFLLEDRLEQNLARAGFTILRPELLSLASQVEAYSGLDCVIFAEGSAIHLAAPLLAENARVCVLWRGLGTYPLMRSPLALGAPALLAGHSDPLGCVVSHRQGAAGWQAVRSGGLQLNFETLGRQLAAQEFIGDSAWEVPTSAEAEAAIEACISERAAATPGHVHRFMSIQEMDAERASAESAAAV